MLKDSVTIVTGGAGLIGSSFSKAIVDSRGKVVIGDVCADKGMSLQNELGADNALFVKVNTSDVESIDRLIKMSKKKFGKIDSVIHCAYPYSRQWGTKFEDLTKEGLKDDLFNQLGGAILLSQRSILFFRKQGYGNLIHISSIQGVCAPKFEHYYKTTMVSPIEYSLR